MSLAVQKINPFQMNQLKTSNDVELFAGSVVAFKTDSYYLGSKIRFKLFPDNQESDGLKFGYIPKNLISFKLSISSHKSSFTAYDMSHLLGNDDVSDACALSTDWLKNYSFVLRYATTPEIYAIARAYGSKRAKFYNIFSNKYIKNFLQAQLLCNFPKDQERILEENLIDTTPAVHISLVKEYLAGDTPDFPPTIEF